MPTTIRLEITGLGILLYSPPLLEEIPEGADWFTENLTRPEDVARHVNSCTLAAIGTGSPGTYIVRLHLPGEAASIVPAEAEVMVGLTVREDCLAVRDIYDLMEWTKTVPDPQTISLPSGYYRLAVSSNRPASGSLGDEQSIDVVFEPVEDMPSLRWQGVPDLSLWLE